MTITLLNPAISSANIGDWIIVDAILRELNQIFPEDTVVSIPTQDTIGATSRLAAARAKHRIVGGTNLLSAHMLSYRQWKIGFLDSLQLSDVTLMGVGWWQYQSDPDLYTRTLLRRVLSRTKIHSVRDSYTEAKLRKIGINNVVNTACPTMWRLDARHCASVPATKGREVVFTLTDYKQVARLDIALIELLKSKYDRVYYWPQGTGDLNYFSTLGARTVTVLPMTLRSFDELLESDISLDFVGTRLHGGIRALQKRRRALILAVDNRSTEIARDTNLAVLPRDNLSAISDWIMHPRPTTLRIPTAAIESWIRQSLFVHGT